VIPPAGPTPPWFSDRIHRLPIPAALHRGVQDTPDTRPDTVLPIRIDARRAPFSSLFWYAIRFSKPMRRDTFARLPRLVRPL
jgi:hypothetical protein